MLNKYELLVNKEHKISCNVEKELNLIKVTNSEGNEFLVEEETYNQFILLKDIVKEKENIIIEIDSGYRSVERQKNLYDEFVKTYGKEHADKVVAPYGYSEHHTGMAIDIAVSIENEGYIDANSEFKRNEKILKEHVHKYLSMYRFYYKISKKQRKYNWISIRTMAY